MKRSVFGGLAILVSALLLVLFLVQKNEIEKLNKKIQEQEKTVTHREEMVSLKERLLLIVDEDLKRMTKGKDTAIEVAEKLQKQNDKLMEHIKEKSQLLEEFNKHVDRLHKHIERQDNILKSLGKSLGEKKSP